MFQNNVPMFLCLRLIVRYFQCFVRGSSPSGKVISHEPPYPSEIAAFEPTLPLRISNDLPWGGGGGKDIFWNHTLLQRACLLGNAPILHKVLTL